MINQHLLIHLVSVFICKTHFLCCGPKLGWYCASGTYLLWPSNFRIIIPRKVFCGATWPLLTGMFAHDFQWGAPLQVNPEVTDVGSLWCFLYQSSYSTRALLTFPLRRGLLQPVCMTEHVNASSPKRADSGRIAWVRFSSQSMSRCGWMRSWRPL